MLTIDEVIERIGETVYLEANLKHNQYKCYAYVSCQAAGRVRFTLKDGSGNKLYLLKSGYGDKWMCWDNEDDV